MSTSHIRYSSLYADLIKDIEEIYFITNHNYEKKTIEIKESYGGEDSLGIIFYEKKDSASVIAELKKLNSFDDSNLICTMNAADWNSHSVFWINNWGNVKFKMKLSESDLYKRSHKYSSSKSSKDLRVEIVSAPDQGLCGWGDTEDFHKRAKTVLAGLNKSTFLTLSEWNTKEAVAGVYNPSYGPKCECGIPKIYGKDVNPFFHSRWCNLFVNKS